jgi:hypothetical protein
MDSMYKVVELIGTSTESISAVAGCPPTLNPRAGEYRYQLSRVV